MCHQSIVTGSPAAALAEGADEAAWLAGGGAADWAAEGVAVPPPEQADMTTAASATTLVRRHDARIGVPLTFSTSVSSSGFRWGAMASGPVLGEEKSEDGTR
jgi:hypothetical protein